MDIREFIISRATGKPKIEPVNVPGWEGLYVHEMSGTDRDDYEAAQSQANKSGRGLRNFRARLLVRSIVDADGKRVFTDEDAESLGKLPSSEIIAIFDHAAELNGLAKETEESDEKNC